MLDRDGYDVACPREPGMRMSYAALGLQSPFPQPPVRQAEARTAMVVLSVVDANRASILKHRAVLRNAVRSARHELRQVEGRVGLVTDAGKEDLPVQIVHATYRAFRDVGRQRERVGGDLASPGADRREGMEVVAPSNAGQLPECLRNHSETP